MSSSLREYVKARLSNPIDDPVFDLLWDLMMRDGWVYVTPTFIETIFEYGSMNAFRQAVAGRLACGIDWKTIDVDDRLITDEERDNIIPSRQSLYAMTPPAIMRLMAKSAKHNVKKYHVCLMEMRDLIRDRHHAAPWSMVDRTVPHRESATEVRIRAIREDMRRLSAENAKTFMCFIHERDDTEAFMIGFSSDIAAEMAELQRGNRRPLVCHTKVGMDAQKMQIIGAFVHGLLNDRHIDGDWFRLRVADIPPVYAAIRSKFGTSSLVMPSECAQ